MGEDEGVRGGREEGGIQTASGRINKCIDYLAGTYHTMSYIRAVLGFGDGAGSGEARRGRRSISI